MLMEEMRRVLRSLRYEEREWLARAYRPHPNLLGPVVQGYTAYALRQAADRVRMRKSFEANWSATEPKRWARGLDMSDEGTQTAVSRAAAAYAAAGKAAAALCAEVGKESL